MRKVYERRFKAILVVAAIFLSTNPVASSGPSQEKDEIRTMKGIYLVEGRMPGEPTSLHARRIYWKTPGQQRSEFLRVPRGVNIEEFEDRADFPVEQIILTRQRGGKRLETRLHPDYRMATHMMHSISDQEEESSDYLRYHMPGFSEQLKALLESEEKESKGTKRIDDFEAEGYSIDIADVVDFATGTLTITVWLDRKTGIPLEITMQGEEGLLSRMRYADLVLNEELPDHLFDAGDLEGWTVYDYTQLIEDFTHTSLKPGVRVKVGPTGGVEPLITDDDIVTVKFVSGEFDEHANLRWAFSLILKPRAADRLESFANKHIADLLSTDFNDKIHLVSQVYEVVKGRILTIPAHSLNMTPKEFEEKYLFTSDNRQPDSKPTCETTTEVIFRIEFSGDEDAEARDNPVIQEKLDLFLEAIRLWLDEPGVEEILWRDGNLLVIRIEANSLTGIDCTWTREAVEKYLNLELPTFGLLIVAPNEHEPGGDEFDVAERTKELLEFLKSKESTDGGWSHDIDLSSLAFDEEVDGKKVHCEWLPFSSDYLKSFGLPISEKYTCEKVTEVFRTSGVWYKRDISSFFNLVLTYMNREWRFTIKDIESYSEELGYSARPLIRFDLCDTRKKDFANFTKSHIKRRIVVVINGMIIADPRITMELPGTGIISGPRAGYAESELKRLLAQLKRAQSGLRISKYEFIENK